MKIERRYHPRKAVTFDVELVISQRLYTTRATNISLGGIQLKSTPEIISALEQLTLSPIECQIALDSKQMGKISLAVRLIIKRRVTQCNYLLGFKFINLSLIEQQQLNILVNNI